MPTNQFQYQFAPVISWDDIEDSLRLALIVAETLHGNTDVRLETRYYLDRAQHQCVIDASTASGRDFNRVFAGLLTREFGSDAFSVERLDGSKPLPAVA